jgi:uncharacterized protein (DUF1501 family)
MSTPKSPSNAKTYGDKHHEEHEYWSRRNFLKNLGFLGAGSMMLGKLPVSALMASPLTNSLNESSADRVLVLIRLQGGNDGLNTVIPTYDYSTYRNLRPMIAIPESQVLQWSDALGVHPALEPLYPLWQNGGMKILNNVGYPEQNLSHFRSSDIWATSSEANIELDRGWLGRYFDEILPNFIEQPPAIPPAIQIGGSGDLLFAGMDDINYAVSVPSPEQLNAIAAQGQLYNVNDVPACLYGSQLSYLRNITNNTFKYASVISNAFESGQNTINYQGTLGRQLGTIARLIKGNLGTKLYVVTLNGFDTHANQLNNHQRLLNDLATSVASFYQDLAASGLADKVLSLTFSEFGRRPNQNSSQGTDHGAAAPILIFGPSLSSNGFMGPPPRLRQLDDNGNLLHDLDFRSVYATVLEKWLCIDPSLTDTVIGNVMPRVDLGFDCITTSQIDYTFQQSLTHQARYLTDGTPLLFIQPISTAPIEVTLWNAMGQLMGTLGHFQGSKEVIQVPIPMHLTTISGYYFYRIKTEGRVYSGKVLIK